MKKNTKPTRGATVRVKRSPYSNGREIVNYVPRSVGVPDKQQTVLRYADVIHLSGTAAQYTFRANSLFDPDYTSAGHQPLYFDQFTASYQRYRVYSCKIKLHSVNNSQTAPCEAVVIPASLVPTITSISLAKELPRSVPSGILPSYQSMPVCTSINLSTNTVLGLTAYQIYDQDYGAAYTANPVELWYYSIYGWCPIANGLDLYINVSIEYNVEFYDRAPISGS
jgi:hypothetical protein